MNVVFVNCTYDTFTPGNSGAIGTWIYEVCRVAESDGVCPLLITRSSIYPQHDRPNTVMIDYPTLPSGRIMSKMLGLQKRLAGWVRPRQETWCARVASAIRRARAEGWPLVLHNDMELAASLRRRFPAARIFHLAHNHCGTTERFRRLFAGSVNVAMAVSDFASRWNEDFYRLKPRSVQTLYNGVDTDAFVPRQRQESAMPVINYVGKLDRTKGPDILLDAAIRLASRTRDFSVQIVGRKLYDREDSDDYVLGLQRQGEQLRKAGVECRFTGWIDRKNLPAVLGQAHIHVTPSRWDEPFGLTTLEAMSSGMAVIGANTGGTAEVIGEDGFLFERDDPSRLTDLLERLVANPSLRIEYGRRARARAETFSWRRTWRQLRDILAADSGVDTGAVDGRIVGVKEYAT